MQGGVSEPRLLGRKMSNEAGFGDLALHYPPNSWLRMLRA
jgi:hypothetical protein